MIEQIRQCVSDHMEYETLEVTGGDGRFEIQIVAEAFRELSRVKQQQLVYASIKHLISDGSLHAVTIKAQAPAKSD